MPPCTSSDTTGQSIPAPRTPSQPPAEVYPDDLGDDLLAALLIRMWTLASGRTLRRDLPPDQLSQDELVGFWADDMNPSAGRHVLPLEPQPAATGHTERSPRNSARRALSTRSTRSCQNRPQPEQSCPASPVAPEKPGRR
jgi:hypothetical protein